MADVVDTSSVAAGERFDFWWSEVSRSFQPVTARALSGAPFRGRMTALDLGAYRAHHVTGDAWALRRTPRAIADSDPGLIQLALQLRGRALIGQAGRRTVLRPGDLATFDTSRPYVAGHDVPFEIALFCVPRALLGAHAARMTDRAAIAVRGDSGTGRLVGRVLRDVLRALRDGAVPERAAEIGDGALDMIRALYPADGADAAGVPGPAILGEVRAWVEEHLGDSELSPATIAARHAISVRYLHRLFEAEDLTLSRWIRARRLQRARADLLRGGPRREPVADVAARWGFRDAASFSRAFREEHGCSPSELRAGARADRGSARHPG